MENSLEKLRNKIKELEDQLKDYSIALRVMESLEEIDRPKQAIHYTFSQAAQKISLREQVIKIIKEFPGNVTTDEVIKKYMDIKNIKDRQIAGNSIYPTLSNLAKEGEIVKTSIPNSVGSCWKVKE